jgi:NAD(P)-dependent dehydrogenase (short-subunit alcohol dehydrogenase family)
MSLAGLSVVVSGAGTGIGRAIARRALGEGAVVTVVGRRERLLKELGPEVEVVVTDITQPGAAEHVVSAALGRFGRLDAVVNNAGVARFGRLEDVGVDSFDEMFATNVRAPAELIRCALPQLRANRGSVVNVSSVGGVLVMPGRSLYGASKAALNSLTRSLARELAPEVRVNAVLPGPVDTPMWTDMGFNESQTAELRSDLVAATPMARFGEADEIAGWVCCLVDPQLSGWVTGVLVPVDGGRTT